MPFPLLVPVFFFSSWLLMMFWGMVSPGLGIPTVGYPTAMLITIGLWLVVGPLARNTGGKGGGKKGMNFNFGKGGGTKGGFDAAPMAESFRQRFQGNSESKEQTWESSDEDSVNISASFASVSRRVNSSNFTGGDINANFGGAQVDLRDATMAPGGATINVKAFMGGVGIIVPENWDVQVDVSASMGGVEDERTNKAATGPDAPKLRITGSVTVGGLNLKNA